jgi:hypothetical protein
MKFESLYNMLTKTEQATFYKEVRDLREDLEFFNLYIKRNKKSSFSFTLTFTQGLSMPFLNELYSSYGYNTRYLETLYAEYLVVKHFFNTLYDEETEVFYSDKDLKDIYEYFLNMHSIKLEDYVSSFIGCSRGCNAVHTKVLELIK